MACYCSDVIITSWCSQITGVGEARVSLRPPLPEDSGDYVCVAVNEVGTAIRRFQIRVMGQWCQWCHPFTLQLCWQCQRCHPFTLELCWQCQRCQWCHPFTLELCWQCQWCYLFTLELCWQCQRCRWCHFSP